MKVILFIVSMIISTDLLAQKSGNIWCFGFHYGLDFNTKPPTTFTGCEINTLEGCSSIAHPVTGKLLFYTDGITVWDKNHNPMPASLITPLHGNESSTQSALIVPFPGDKQRYYIFTTQGQTGDVRGMPSMCYSIVNMSLNGGNGDLTTINTLLIDSSSEKLTAIAANCSGTAYWIVGHRYNSDTFYAFKLTATGLSSPVKSKVGCVHIWPASGAMKFSSDAKKLGLVNHYGLNPIELFDFNNITGVISNPMSFPSSVSPYGCSFSPDNSKFYVCGGSQIYQYDMKSPDILASGTLVGSFASWTAGTGQGALQNGPDGRLYISISFRLDVITNPNELGIACNYVAGKAPTIEFEHPLIGLPSLPEDILSVGHIGFFSPPSNYDICFCDTLNAPQPVKNIFSISPGSYSVNADSSLVRFFPSTTTTYTIVSTNECGFTDTMQFTVTVHQPPVAEFDFMPTAPKLSDAMLTLVNKSSGANKYAWYTDGVKTSDSIHFKMPNPGLGTHCYTLNASAMLGCEDTVTHCIEVVKSSIAIPNAFSPNKDGRNDGFKALLFSPYQSFSMSIFNRYGQEVFDTKDPNIAWDGTFRNQPEDLGVYYYLIKVIFNAPEEEIFKGDISLIR